MTYTKDEQLAILEKLREPFPPNQVSRLPKPTRAQTDAVKNDFKAGIRCAECGQWHHPKVEHLDYVGHAALTDRLLSVDPFWNYAPMAKGADGLPSYDGTARGLWIELTVGGMTRPGYGDADGKTGGNAIKEMIGDALRNAAMRFGCALDLWHKGDLHVDDPQEVVVVNDVEQSLELTALLAELQQVTDFDKCKPFLDSKKDIRAKLLEHESIAFNTAYTQHKATLKPKHDEPISDQQAAILQIRTLSEVAKVAIADIFKKYSVMALNELTLEQANDCIDALKARVAKSVAETDEPQKKEKS